MNVKGVILDLDGTVYFGNREVAGAGDFVRRCRAQGMACLFVTNRTNRLPETVCEHLDRYGIACTPKDVLTASQATAEFLERGSAYMIGEEGLRVALEDAGFTLVDDGGQPDYVIVGFDRFFTYEKLSRACQYIHGGARFIATNPDKGLKIEDRISPGTGATLAAAAAGSGQEPAYVGKPERHIMDMALRHLGLEAGQVVAVGDNLDTDIPAGLAAGIRSALILTGISTRDDLATAACRPTWVVETYEELAAVLGLGIDE